MLTQFNIIARHQQTYDVNIMRNELVTSWRMLVAVATRQRDGNQQRNNARAMRNILSDRLVSTMYERNNHGVWRVANVTATSNVTISDRRE